MEAYASFVIGRNHRISKGSLWTPSLCRRLFIQRSPIFISPVLSYQVRYLKKKKMSQHFKTKAGWPYWPNDLQTPFLKLWFYNAVNEQTQQTLPLWLQYEDPKQRIASSHKSWINSYLEFSGWWHRGFISTSSQGKFWSGCRAPASSSAAGNGFSIYVGWTPIFIIQLGLIKMFSISPGKCKGLRRGSEWWQWGPITFSSLSCSC